MKKMSKILCLAICIFMVFTAGLTGCTKSAGNEDTADKSTVTGTAAEPTKAELEPYEIAWYFGGNGSEPNEKLVEDEIGKYLKDKINTTVDITTFPLGEYDQKMNTIISSGEKVDLAFSCSWLFPYLNVARTGMAIELTDDMLTKNAPHAKDVLSGPFMDGAKVDGKLYHLPCNKEIGAQGGVLLNKKLVDKYGFDITTIKKYEDLTPMLQTIKDKEKDIYPLGTCGGDSVGQLVDCQGNWSPGAPMWIKLPMGGTKWATQFDIPEVVNILKLEKKFNDMGFIRKDAVTVGDINPDLKAGKVFATHMQLKPGKDKEMSNQTPGVEWVQVPLTDCVIRSGDVTGSMMFIPKTCPSPERALQFYDYFYCDRNLLTIVNYGVENLHWVKVDDNTIDYAPATENGTKSGWRPPFSIWMVGDQFQNYVLKGEDPKKYENLKAFNAACKPFGDSTGFLFDGSKCQNAYDKLIASGADQYSLLMIGQAGDVDAAIAKQMKTWNDAGLQEVLTEYNKQYEAFVAAK